MRGEICRYVNRVTKNDFLVIKTYFIMKNQISGILKHKNEV